MPAHARCRTTQTRVRLASGRLGAPDLPLVDWGSAEKQGVRASLLRRVWPGHLVAHTDFGEYVAWVIGVVTQLVPDGADGGANGPNVAVPIISPDTSQQVFVSHNAPRVDR